MAIPAATTTVVRHTSHAAAGVLSFPSPIGIFSPMVLPSAVMFGGYQWYSHADTVADDLLFRPISMGAQG
jgi:hypothetical protein